MSQASPFVRVGVAVLITRDARLLLIRRQGSHGAGTWATPGGHLDFGETPEQCGIREVREETGLDVAELAFVAITNDLFENEQKQYITIWMETRQVAGEPVIAEPREMTEIGWFGWDALPQPLFLPLANLVLGELVSIVQHERLTRLVPYDLYRLLQCPTCGSRDLVVSDAGVCCAACRSDYPRHDGYLDLMPRAVEFGYVSKYVSEEQELAEELDYRALAPPLLAAGVRNRALLRLLDLRPEDIVLDSGCGTAKFAAWNAEKVRLMVGADPATLFADVAVEQVALAKADSRRLPFADGAFDKAFSIDVLEHFPRDVIDAYLAETARVLRPGGRLLIFSNTSDPSSLQPLANLSRRLGRLFVRAGLYDFQREARRKSDHIKALRTWDDVLDAMRQAGLRPVKIVFWNSVFTSFVEHVLMKLGEAVLGRKTKDEGRKTKDEGRALYGGPSVAAPPTTDDGITTTQNSELKTQNSDGTDREIRARRRMRERLERRGPAYYALMAVTLLMELDLWLFGRLRSGSYFIVVEKP